MSAVRTFTWLQRTVAASLLAVALLRRITDASSCPLGIHSHSLLDQLQRKDESGNIVPHAQLPAAPYAEWAHYHWVWLSNDRANQEAMIEYTQEYLDHGIPVGAVDIDSEWETGFNNFVFNEKYPNPQEMVDWYHNRSIRIIMWITSMIDTDSDNYEEGLKNEYYIKDVFGKTAVLKWWHGHGSLLDYTNPKAVAWWHAQMDKVLHLGIDGWKCDGTDPYIIELIVPRGHTGTVSYREYANSYYGDFLNHTRSVVGDEALIMSRPVDGWGFVFLDFSPRRVVFSGWVGDEDPTFEGLQNALKRYLQSAWAGYANFGSDIGGYRSGNSSLGRSKELFIRWAQLGAFSPLMENGGNKEHRPWMFDTNNETLNIYKKYVSIHYKLVPYLLTTGTLAYEHNTSSIQPLAPHQSFINKLIDDFQPLTYNYLLGDDILVCPITSHPPVVNVKFPHVDGNDTWVAWWNSSLVYSAGEKAQFKNFFLDTFTVFHRQGVLIPLRDDFSSGQTTPKSDHLTLFVDSPTNRKPHPVQVRDRAHGLVAAYWHIEEREEVHFNVSAHSELQLSIVIQRLPFQPYQAIICRQCSNFMITGCLHAYHEEIAPSTPHEEEVIFYEENSVQHRLSVGSLKCAVIIRISSVNL